MLTILFTSCVKQRSEEPTTDDNDRIIAAIDKSTPISQGNLITKTDTDNEGNLNINYFDSDGNLVENFVWTETENIAHSVMTYSDSNMLILKEEINADGKTSSVEAYKYDTENNLTEKTVSEVQDGKTTKSTVYDSDDKILNSTAFSFNANDTLSKKEIFDSKNKLVEYLIYEYNDKFQNTKCSVFNADSTLKSYTCFEYNSSGLITKEQKFDGKDNLLDYYEMDYAADGSLSASRHFDSDGNLLSEDIMQQ